MEYQLELLDSFRTAIIRWHAAAILPLDQLVLIVGQDLVLESSEIAIIQKLAGFISSLRDNNPPLDRDRHPESTDRDIQERPWLRDF